MGNKKVLQIGIDIVVGCDCDKHDLVHDVFMELSRRGFNVVSAGFQEDVTEEYKQYNPDIIKD